jgi:hypothetical protein
LFNTLEIKAAKLYKKWGDVRDIGSKSKEFEAFGSSIYAGFFVFAIAEYRRIWYENRRISGFDIYLNICSGNATVFGRFLITFKLLIWRKILFGGVAVFDNV